jgi:hypothetical protein
LINVYELRHFASCELQCIASSLRVPCNCTMRCKKTTGNFVNLLKYEWSVQEGLIPSPPHADNTLRIRTLETILGQFKAKNTAVLSSPEPQTSNHRASISNTMERIIKDGMWERVRNLSGLNVNIHCTKKTLSRGDQEARRIGTQVLFEVCSSKFLVVVLPTSHGPLLVIMAIYDWIDCHDDALDAHLLLCAL